MPEPARLRILTWMCVLIAVNQLGFGSIVPALAPDATTARMSTSQPRSSVSRCSRRLRASMRRHCFRKPSASRPPATRTAGE